MVSILPWVLLLQMLCRAKSFIPIGATRHAHVRLFSQGDDLNVGIVGGGLAGLSTAYHLLQKNPSVRITIFDPTHPGNGGASSVAGGLLHPLTPRGKIAYLGLEGLKASSALIEEATKHEKNIILRDEIFRVALNDDHVSALKQAKLALPDQTQWLEANELEWATPTLLGALRIHSGGCKVVHMPTYLKGLWSVCKTKGTKQAEWIVESSCRTKDFDWKERLASFDTVVLCAGSGLFQNSIVKNKLPMQVVRGQSIELSLGERTFENALLCGKYATPLPESNRVLIGATQEFKGEPLDADEVASELKKKTNSFASHLWEDSNVDKITTGFRVQSNRGKNGRMPILGRLETPIHDDAWIFTGLSSRGLLYHGIFGDVLSDMILNTDGENEMVDPQDLQWWKKQKMKQK